MSKLKTQIDEHFEQINERPYCQNCFEARKGFDVADRKKGKFPTRSNMLLGFYTKLEFVKINVLVLAESHGGGRADSFYYPNKSFKDELNGLYHYYMESPIHKFHQQQMRILLKYFDEQKISWLFTDLVKSYVTKDKINFEAAISHCVQYLDEQLDLYKPDVIICMGDYNYKYMATKFSLPKQANHADVFKIDETNILLIKSYFPSRNTADYWAESGGWDPIINELQRIINHS